jgi:hypothetical protein
MHFKSFTINSGITAANKHLSEIAIGVVFVVVLAAFLWIIFGLAGLVALMI